MSKAGLAYWRSLKDKDLKDTYNHIVKVSGDSSNLSVYLREIRQVLRERNIPVDAGNNNQVA